MLMHFRIKNIDRIVGIFVILALALIIFTLIFVARGQKWFTKHHPYMAVFEEIEGLKPGSMVTISGMEVGEVKSLRLNSQSQVEIKLEVVEPYEKFVRLDSQATISGPLLGSKVLEITAGSPDQPPIPPGGKIETVEPRDITDIVKELDLKTPLKKVNDALENVKTITSKLNSPEGELFTALKNVEFITVQLKKGEGGVGAILQDKKMHADIAAAVESLRLSASNVEKATQEVSKFLPGLLAQVDRSIQEVPPILQEVKRATADLSQTVKEVEKAAADAPVITGKVKDIAEDLKGITGGLQKTVPQIPEFLTAAQEGVEEAEKLIQGLENSWLLRGFFAQPRRETPLAISQRESPYQELRRKEP